MEQILRDNAGRKIGEIRDYGGRSELYDAHGRRLGIYDGTNTFDSYGRKIGNGNLLATLLR